MVETQAEASMVKLKKLAEQLLPSNSTLRFLILSEPDNLSTEAARAKVDVYVKLLYEEIKRGLIKCPICSGIIRPHRISALIGRASRPRKKSPLVPAAENPT